MKFQIRLLLALATFVLLAALLPHQADAQYRGRVGLSRYGGVQVNVGNVRSHTRSASGYATTYYTNRSPSYRYAVGHPLSQSSYYSRSPSPRAHYSGSSTVIQFGNVHRSQSYQPQAYRSYGHQPNYGHPSYGNRLYIAPSRGISIGIGF